MTINEIMAMAREAGFRTGQINLSNRPPVPFIAPASGTNCMDELERFAALVAAATQQAGEVVAYLDIGAGGYLDLGSALSDEAMQQLPKGRHALVIAGTYGIDGYVAAPQPAPATQQVGGVKLEPVYGDVLPPVGSRVFIRHGFDNDAHACIVTGYYAWGGLHGNKRLHRVFVRMVYEGTTTEQARRLCDCYPTSEAALAARKQGENHD